MSEKMELADALQRYIDARKPIHDEGLLLRCVAALRTSSPAQEHVTTEPVADVDQVAQSFQKWRAEHTRNFYLPWTSLDERQQEHVREEVRTVLAFALPAPPTGEPK